jgi:hypothetical protein
MLYAWRFCRLAMRGQRPEAKPSWPAANEMQLLHAGNVYRKARFPFPRSDKRDEIRRSGYDATIGSLRQGLEQVPQVLGDKEVEF